MRFVISDNLSEIAPSRRGERSSFREARQDCVKRMQNHSFTCKNLQLVRIADVCMDEMKNPGDARPKLFSHRHFRLSAKFRHDPLLCTGLDLFHGALAGGESAGRRSLWKLGDKSDWSKADLHFDMPSNDCPVRVCSHGEQIHLIDAVLDATDREEAFPV